MLALLQIGLSNVLVAAVLTLPALAVSRWARRPALAHSLWLLVLLKLLTPPFVTVPISWPAPASAPEAALAPHQQPAAPVADEPAPVLPPEPAALVEQAPPLAEDMGPQEGTAEVKAEPPTARPAPPEPVAVPLPPPRVLPQQTAPPAPAPTTPTAPAPAVPPDWPALIGLVWLSGAALWLGLSLVGHRRFARLLRLATPAPDAIQEHTAELARRLGLARWPRVWLLPGALSPMLWAAGTRPRLLLPAQLLAKLGPEQRATLLVHELAHFRRRDHWLRYLELVVTGLYWWCPLVWWARRELHQAEEECCDAWVVWALPSSARAYATALVDTLDFLANARPTLPLGASGLGQVNRLKRRVIMIMRGRTPRSLTRAGTLVLLAAGLLLPLLPVQAQTEDVQTQLEGQLQKRRADQQQDWQQKRQQLERLLEEMEDLRSSFQKQRKHFEKRVHDIQEKIKHLEQEGSGPTTKRPDPRPKAPMMMPPGGNRPMMPGQGGRPPVPVANPYNPSGLPGPNDPFAKAPPSAARPPGSSNVEHRLQELERKMDRILRLLEQQHGGRMAPPGGGTAILPGRPGSPGGFPPGGSGISGPGDNRPVGPGIGIPPGAPGAGRLPGTTPAYPGGGGYPSPGGGIRPPGPGDPGPRPGNFTPPAGTPPGGGYPPGGFVPSPGTPQPGGYAPPGSYAPPGGFAPPAATPGGGGFGPPGGATPPVAVPPGAGGSGVPVSVP